MVFHDKLMLPEAGLEPATNGDITHVSPLFFFKGLNFYPQTPTNTHIHGFSSSKNQNNWKRNIYCFRDD